MGTTGVPCAWKSEKAIGFPGVRVTVMSHMWVLGLEPDLGGQLVLFSVEGLVGVPTLVCGRQTQVCCRERDGHISVWPLGLEVLVLVSRSVLALAVTM